MGGTHDPYAVEIARDNELINDRGTVKNIYDSKAADGTVSGTPNSRYYQPCVTIPVEDMSVSEPPWGYGPREKEAADEEKAIRQKNGLNSATSLTFKYTNDHKKVAILEVPAHLPASIPTISHLIRRRNSPARVPRRITA